MYSIIMPVYNVEKYLNRSIVSIRNQKFKNWELLIVNDGSTDNSGIICQKYVLQDERIKYFEQENAGSGKARAVALKNAIGDYVCFVDPDDFLSDDALSENTKILATYCPDILVNGYYELEKENAGNLTTRKIKSHITGNFDKKEFREKFPLFDKIGSRSLWNKIYKREFLVKNNIQFTDQRVGQDAVFNYTAYKYVNNIIVNERAYYYYDISRENSVVKQYRERRAEYEKKIADTYTHLLQNWKLDEKYFTDILLVYWNVVFVELRNLSSSKNNKTKKEKVEQIKKVTNIKEISYSINYLKYGDMKNIFHKVLLYFLKNSKYLWALLFMKVRLSSPKKIKNGKIK